MTDYTDLIAWLRRAAIRPDLGELRLFEAADALEAQAQRIAELESMIAVHRLAVDVDAMKARIAELEAALKPFADMADSYEKIYSTTKPTDDMNYVGKFADLRAARAAYLGEKE